MNIQEIARRLETAAKGKGKGAGTAKIVDLSGPKIKADAGYKRAFKEYTQDGKKGVIVMREYDMEYSEVVRMYDFIYVKTPNDLELGDGYMDDASQELFDSHSNMEVVDGDFKGLQLILGDPNVAKKIDSEIEVE